jgi:hypothetical protein
VIFGHRAEKVLDLEEALFGGHVFESLVHGTDQE